MDAVQTGTFSPAIVFAAVSVAQSLLAFIVGCWYGQHVRARRRLAREYDSAAQTLLRLHEWTASVGDSVGAHQSEVKSNADELETIVARDGDDWKWRALEVVKKVIGSNERLQRQLNDAERKLNEQAESIRAHSTDARTDPLTCLPNRRALDDELQRRASEWQRKQIPYSVTLVDVDHFKRCNDTYGHPAGDEALRRVARLIRTTLRDMDFAARIGGEEFCIVHPATTLDEAQAAAERVRKAIAESPIEVGGEQIALTVSAGGAQAMPGEITVQLISRADEALYAAKSAGRNRVRISYGDGRSITEEDSSTPAPVASELDEICGNLQRRLEEVAGGI
jgi:diguanylate cyclase (GGDEF)-like protein